MDVVVPSFAEVLSLELAFARNRMPLRAWSEWHDNYRRLEVNAGAVGDLHEHLRSLGKAGSPLTAEDADLDAWGNLRSTPRGTATPASGANAGLIKGTLASPWDTTDILTHQTTGLQFRPSVAGSIPAALQTIVGIVALEPGKAGALGAGEVLEWDSTPPGLEAQVELQSALNDAGTGTDVEKDDAYRVRVVAAWQQQPAGGTPADYVRFMRAEAAPISGIVTAYVWRGRNGKGTVDVAALRSGTGSARLLDAGERTALLTYLEPIAPGPEGLRVLEVTIEDTDVDYTIEPEAGVANSRDWDDTSGLTVSTYTPATRTLVLSANRPASIRVGHRMVIAGTPGVQLVVQSLSGVNAVVLKEDLGFTITAAEAVYSGGGAVKPARDAIIALFNSLGPRRGRYAAQSLPWFSTLGSGRLFEVVQTADGVLDSAPVSPVADVEPTELRFPDDGAVNLLTPLNIVVHYA